MKYLVTIILLLTLINCCVSQSKRKKIREINTDTVDVFRRLDNKIFKEKNVFWVDKNEVGIIQSQRSDDPCCVDDEYELNLTVVFDDWNSIVLSKDYGIAELRTDCEIKTMFGGHKFNKPIGQIRVTEKSKDLITFHFNITVLSENSDKFLIYKGDRKFRPDY